MNLAGITFLLGGVLPAAAGKPLQPGAPGPLFAAAGQDVVLPCGSVSVSRVVTVEWSRVDGPSPVTVLVVRGGEELPREQSAEFRGRTAATEAGALRLRGVTRRDSGTYRCVPLGGSSNEETVFVSLVVAEMSEVDLTVQRTPSNQLFVHCESSGWGPKPAVSLLDGVVDTLAVHEASDGPDNFWSVRAHLDTAAAKGTGTLTCRVEVREMGLVKENKIHVSDQYSPVDRADGCVLVCVPVCLILLFFIIVLVCIQRIETLRSALRHLQAFVIRLCRRGKGERTGETLLGGHETYTEYGDVMKVDTTGASEGTAKANGLSGELLTGVDVSRKLAEKDLQEMMKYREDIVTVGATLRVHPALIAAIISRQSQAGTRLDPQTGFGLSDPNCFGVMQINRHYHAVKGNPYSREHVDQGVTFIIQLIKTMWRMKPTWTREQQLKGALACYIAGEDKVIPLSYEDVDSVTPYGDFANDVVARAHWFTNSDFMSSVSPSV